MNDWSYHLTKVEQNVRKLTDALNDRKYMKAATLCLRIMYDILEVQAFILKKL